LAFSYSTFTYASASQNLYATPLTRAVIFPTPFAPIPLQASKLLDKNITYTRYALDANTSDTAQFGQKSYADLWQFFSYRATLPFTTTIQPTAVPASELILPPPLYTACPSCDSCLTCSKLPYSFVWGVAASAWQTEGGLKSEGRGPALPDIVGNLYYPSLASSNDSMVSDMHYFMYKQDIVRLAAIGIPYYSFSISWTRIVPFGSAGSPINLPGLEHYDDVINTCLQFGIKPIVTLNHFDIPASTYYSAQTFSDDFLYYAKQVMVRYGDRVPYWVTFNEPNIASTLFDGLAISNTQLLLAHAAVYRFYKNELNGTGQVLWKWGHLMGIPRDMNNPEDIRAAKRYQDFELGILSRPLFLGQNYPPSVLNTTGFDLDPLTPEELAYINGTIDLYGIDPYSSQLVTSPPGGIDACARNINHTLWPECVVPLKIQANGWPIGQASNHYAYITPHYLRQHLSYIWNNFRPRGIFVTEFGFNPYHESQKNADLQRYDLERSMYYDSFLKEILKAIHEDGINVVGALAWSFVDNNEWGSYAEQYGLQTVNRTSGRFERRYKRSFFDFVEFFHRYMDRL
jgi:beta-glucosidase/6-phospho-beta-glucosidase/beta-galactosidase